MLSLINKLFNPACSDQNNHANGQELLQKNHTAASSSSAHTIEWQPLDVTKLNITTNRVREIEASMVKDARNEFAAVMKELNSSQHARKTE
jgi:hypothetical protein